MHDRLITRRSFVKAAGALLVGAASFSIPHKKIPEVACSISGTVATPLTDALYAQNGPSPNDKVWLGLDDIDRALGGFDPGDLVVVASRPGIGKISFAINVAMNAVKIGLDVSMFSLEESRAQVSERCVRILTGLSREKVRCDIASSVHRKRIRDAYEVVDRQNLRIHDDIGLGVEDIGRILQGEYGQCTVYRPRLVIIDYLQLLSDLFLTAEQDASHGKGEAVLQNLKSIARKYGVVVLVLNMLYRDIRAIKRRPTIADSQYMKGAFDSADNILLLDCLRRETEPHHSDRPDFGFMNVIVAKSPSGFSGDVTLPFDRASGRLGKFHEV